MMKKLGRIKNHSGFSLVELMMCIVISAILSLTLGTMLIYIFMAWRNNNDQVEIQRDATITMDILSRAIRPAALIHVPNPTTLNIGDLATDYESFSLGGTGGESLVYDPHSSVDGDETELIKDRLIGLEFEKDSSKRSIIINMRLEQGRESLSLNQTTISYRN